MDIILKKFFPDKVKILPKDPKVNLRGGELIDLSNKIDNQLLKDKVLKIALLFII